MPTAAEFTFEGETCSNDMQNKRSMGDGGRCEKRMEGRKKEKAKTIFSISATLYCRFYILARVAILSALLSELFFTLLPQQQLTLFSG
jgi:hypothetical protein